MRTVHEVSALTGVSIRALHHYDAIGLLPPSAVTDAGYRLYNDAALQRLQSILLLRELRFPLRQIAALLDDPQFDMHAALADQLQLLRLQRQRLDALIEQTEKLQKGDIKLMDFTTFDNTEIKQYQEEAKARWGKTAAWQAYEQKDPAAAAGAGD